MARKTTIYLPDELKQAVEREARHRGSSEAEVIRQAVAMAVAAPAPIPTPGFLDGEPFAARAEELLDGFGD